MTIVAGVDFGTLSVRVSIVDSARGMLPMLLSGVSALIQRRKAKALIARFGYRPDRTNSSGKSPT